MPNPININNTRSKKMTLRNIKNSQEKKQEIQILIRNHDVKIQIESKEVNLAGEVVFLS